MNNIAIFASGSGSNAQAIIEYFNNKGQKPVKIILSNKSDAFVLERAKKFNIPTLTFSREEFYSTEKIMQVLEKEKIDYVVLAGFLWLVPNNILKAFENKIINIHPALLPKYGGKGMYGMKVHEAVVAAKEAETGITIHYVNEEYDKGATIFQAKCAVNSSDSPEDVAKKIHELEYAHFPRVIDEVINKL